MAIPLLEGLPRPKRLIADKAYDAMTLRRWLKKRKIRAVIPSLATRTFPFPLDRKAYKRRSHRAPMEPPQELAAYRHPL